jgi:OFA family oxalate/formate antiporter-like MFS transporter
MDTFNSSALKPYVGTQNRYLILFCCAFLQLCVGINYVWSVFQPFVMKEFGWDASTASMTYTISVLAFVIGSSVSGKIQDRIIPKNIIILCGLFAALGSFLASFTTASTSPLYLYATYGVMVGLGFGVVYNTAVTLSQQWFYDKRGLAGGIVVSSLGFAGIIFTPIINYTLTNFGLKTTFIMLSIFFLTLSFIVSIFIKKPPADYGLDDNSQSIALTTKQYTPKEMLGTHNFYILIASLMCGATAFILINPLLIIIGAQRGIDISVLLIGVMASSLSNALGRLISASVSDLIGRKLTLIILFALSFISCLGLIFAKGYLLVILFSLLAFAYGGFFATFPALTSGMFGLKYSGSNYGLVMLGLGFSSIIAMVITGVIQALGLNLDTRFFISVIIAAVGIVLVFFIKRPKQN